jgi:cupin fold WbuC family metalloprotein
MFTSKKYFKSFDFIKQAYGAKSLSFFTTEQNGSFSKELYNEFSNILENYEDRFRVSLHTSSEDDLHNMIIAMKHGTRVYPHKHERSESYQIVKGKMILVYFDENGSVNKKVLMSQNDTLVARVDVGSYHGIIALEDVIYHETRLGPFISQSDSVFASWNKEKMVAFDEM